MAISFFENKLHCPNDSDLETVLGEKYTYWLTIKESVYATYPRAMEEWIFSGKNYGWSFRIKDRRRVILYFIPCDKYFKVAFVFGEKAMHAALSSTGISAEIKKIIEEAPIYAEGRGFRIDINDAKLIQDIKKLVTIKLDN